MALSDAPPLLMRDTHRAGDLPGALSALRKCLIRMRYANGSVSQQRLLAGDVAEHLPIVRWAIGGNYAHKLTQDYLHAGQLESAAAIVPTSDVRLVETLFRLLRNYYNYHPGLSVAQYLAPGYAERKLVILCDLLTLSEHRLMQMQRRDQIEQRRFTGVVSPRLLNHSRPQSAAISAPESKQRKLPKTSAKQRAAVAALAAGKSSVSFSTFGSEMQHDQHHQQKYERAHKQKFRQENSDDSGAIQSQINNRVHFSEEGHVNDKSNEPSNSSDVDSDDSSMNILDIQKVVSSLTQSVRNLTIGHEEIMRFNTVLQQKLVQTMVASSAPIGNSAAIASTSHSSLTPVSTSKFASSSVLLPSQFPAQQSFIENTDTNNVDQNNVNQLQNLLLSRFDAFKHQILGQLHQLQNRISHLESKIAAARTTKLGQKNNEQHLQTGAAIGKAHPISSFTTANQADRPPHDTATDNIPRSMQTFSTNDDISSFIETLSKRIRETNNLLTTARSISERQ